MTNTNTITNLRKTILNYLSLINDSDKHPLMDPEEFINMFYDFYYEGGEYLLSEKVITEDLKVNLDKLNGLYESIDSSNIPDLYELEVWTEIKELFAVCLEQAEDL